MPKKRKKHPFESSSSQPDPCELRLTDFLGEGLDAWDDSETREGEFRGDSDCHKCFTISYTLGMFFMEYWCS